MAEITKKIYAVDSTGNVEVQSGGAIEASSKPKIESRRKTKKEIISTVPSKFLINQVTIIALKLAIKGAFDTYGRLIYQKKPLPGTNIVDLIHSIVTEGNQCSGYTEFFQVLKTCGIKPSDIANKAIRRKLTFKPSTKDKRKGCIFNPIVFPNVANNLQGDAHESDLNEIDTSSEYSTASETENRNKKLQKRQRKKQTPAQRSPYCLRDAKKWVKLHE